MFFICLFVFVFQNDKRRRLVNILCSIMVSVMRVCFVSIF